LLRKISVKKPARQARGQDSDKEKQNSRKFYVDKANYLLYNITLYQNSHKPVYISQFLLLNSL
jgi:hypothetical protein